MQDTFFGVIISIAGLSEPFDKGLLWISVIYTLKNLIFIIFTQKFKALTAWIVVTNVLNVFGIVYSIVTII